MRMHTIASLEASVQAPVSEQSGRRRKPESTMPTTSGKLAVCVRDSGAEPWLDETFARCRAFALFDEAGHLTGVVENRARDAAGAASTQAVTQLRELGVVGVVAAKYGPNANRVLEQGGIRPYRCPEPLPAREAWRRAVNGELAEAPAAAGESGHVPPHSGGSGG